MAKAQQGTQQKHRKSSKRGRKAPPSDVPVAADKGKGKQVAEPESAERARLRQAIRDLGGDDEDMELLKGIEEDGEEEIKGEKKVVDEKSLKNALSSFMKELNFSAVAPELNDEESEVEDEEEEEEDDEEEEGEDAEEDEDEDDEEDDGDDDEDEDEDDEEVEQTEQQDEDDDEESEEEVAPAPTPVQVAEPAYVEPEFKKKSGLQGASGSNIPASPIWTELAPPLSPQANLPPLSIASIDKLRAKATKLLANLPPLSRSKSSSDATFLAQILSSGTHQDKLSALVLLVRESPVHAVRELEKLRSMAGFKEDGSVGGGGRDERVSVARALSDWWVTGGGKEQGKLRYFADQPFLSHPDITDRHLVLYAFEDFLKKWFFNLLQVLEALSHDTLPFVRTQALNITFQLLAGNAEQEQNLLRLGVNKLGDTDKAVAAKASHHILQLLQTHPAMKAVVARDVATLVLKPVATGPSLPANANKLAKLAAAQKEDKKANAATHARYYGLITLNQMTLTVRDRDVAGRLVEVYFDVFREILGDGSGPEEEPVVEGAEDADGKAIEKVAGKVEKWRGRRKGAKPKGGRQTNKVEESLVEESDAKMVAAVLTGVNRALPFAKLEDDAFEKYMATLFKITHAGTFNTSIQALVLIFQVSTSKQAVSDRFYRTLYESLFDPRLVTSSKQAMYLNLLFKAMKVDTSVPRVMAFVKRLLQMLGMHQPPFICGALFLLGELFNTTPGLKRMLVEPEDDSEEHFVDAPEEGETKVGETSTASKTKNSLGEYDGRKRDPQFAGADASCLWELTPFLHHFHPTVSLYAQYLLKGEALPAGTGSSDISLNTLVSFLDRFVYRNPKKQIAARGASIMQPAAAAKGDSVVIKGRGREGYVNDESFWRKKVEDVPADQLFFHKFFSARLAKEAAKSAQAQKRKGKNADDDDEEGLDDSDVEDDDDDEVSEEEAVPSKKTAEVPADDDSEDSDPEEAEIWKAMKNSMPSAGDDDLQDSDDLDEELSDEDDSDAMEVDGKDEDDEADSPAEDDDFSDDDGSALSFGEDEDDLLSESEMPNIPLGSAFPPSEDEEEAEEDSATVGKRKRDDKKAQRKKRKAMPMFASADDYAALIDAEGDGDE